ncbi:YXWGXW repeat-containing protein [Undibacterium sp.]|jgi:hypothetical protein|uniref:YXWGXW repeat-containing protein n=1 Tax=Undibacterium sp. TaxID=1914977 RepID=UPI002B51C44B|nr:YXWGXW repeat-containing protein [Undibacterium sp.]HTD06738.1 YXWGXW repeat-containing protein [Undibacterium sp.]
MKYVLKTLLIASAVLAIGGCTTTVQERVVVREQPQKVVIRHMPAPVQEVVTMQPAPGYAWVPGHWVWRQTGWQWQSGHWYQGNVRPMPAVIVEQITIAPSPNHFWVPGHWKWHNGEWDWAKGHWEA